MDKSAADLWFIVEENLFALIIRALKTKRGWDMVNETNILIALLVFLGFIGLLVAIILRRVVPTNMVHIVQSSKSTTAYGNNKDYGNTYYAWPSWVPKIGVEVTQLPESIFQVVLENYEAYDQARLPFVVDVTAFFRIEKAETAARRVSSFEELNEQLNAVLQGAVRRVLATNPLETILQSRSDLGNQFTQEVQEQISEWGVLPVKTIEFMDIRDSSKGQVIAAIMDKEKSRIEKESRITIAANIQAAELAEIDAGRTVEVQRQDAAQLIGQRTAEKDQAIGIANEQSQQNIKAEAKTTAERTMEVRKVEEVKDAEIKKDVALVVAEQDRRVQIVKAEANKDATILNADAEKQSVTIRAEGELAAALKDAEGVRAKGLAEADAEKAMLLAPVDTQITLAKEIGSNEGYQQYLISIEKVRAGEKVGMGMAEAMGKADLKVIANSSDVQGGIAKLGDIFTPQGGTNLTGMLTALAQSEEGKKLIDKFTNSSANNA
jgi:flotillin